MNTGKKIFLFLTLGLLVFCYSACGKQSKDKSKPVQKESLAPAENDKGIQLTEFRFRIKVMMANQACIVQKCPGLGNEYSKTGIKIIEMNNKLEQSSAENLSKEIEKLEEYQVNLLRRCKLCVQ